MMNEHKCNQCFYAQYEKDEAPCNGCTGYSKFIKRDIYIKTPTSAPSFQPLQKAIDEWHREQKLNEGCNGLSAQDLNDMVNKPKHYMLFAATELQDGKNIEVRDVIKKLADKLYTSYETPKNMPMAISDYVQLMQYLMRFMDKNGLEDLKKARVYLDWLIDEYEPDF